MKRIKAEIPRRVDAALTGQAVAAETWAGTLRLLYAVICGGMAIRDWQLAHPAGYVWLALAAVWLIEMIVIRARVKKGAAESLIGSSVMTDLTVINLGLVAFALQGRFPADGAGLFFLYFPVLALAATRYRFTLPIKAGIYAGVTYAVISLFEGGSPLLQLVALAAVSAIAAVAAIRPKMMAQKLVTDIAQEAYQDGRKEREIELAVLLHEAFMSPAITDLPTLWCSSKHMAGAETSGDYYHVFDFGGEPLVVVGDLPGRGLEASTDVSHLHRRLTQIVQHETSLSAILRELNSYVWEKHRGKKQFRCFIGRWEGNDLRYINAGLLPTIQIGRQDEHRLPVTSGAVGVQAEATFTENTVPFPARDLLLVYTDGVYRTLTDDADKGVAEIEALAEKFKTGEVNTLCHRVFDCAQPGMDAPLDDRTLVVIRRQPTSAAASGESRAPAA